MKSGCECHHPKRLAGHVHTLVHSETGLPPGWHPTIDDGDIGVAQHIKAIRRSLRNPVTVIHEQHRHALAWHEALHVHLKSAVGHRRRQ